MSLQDTYPCDCGNRVDLNANYCSKCGSEIEIDWPFQFSLYVHGSGNTAEQIKSAGLPHSDEILDALYYYPGEVEIVYEMTESLEVTPMEIKYEGKTWTPESQ